MKRGRNQRRRQGVNINRALDSNGPDVRIRGTANQIYDKYLALARDATSSGDRVKTENYLQHAEHYFRLIRSIQPSMPMNNDSMDGDGDQPMLSDNQGQDAQQQHRQQDRQQDYRQQDNRQQDNRHQQRRNDQNGYDDRSSSAAQGDEDDGDASANDAPQASSETASPRPQQSRPQASQRREGGEGGEGPARRRRRPRRPTQDGDAPAPEEREEEPVVDAAE
jgi:hypothetical protein